MINITDRHKQRILEYIEKYPNLENPIKIVAKEVLLNQFGIPDEGTASYAKKASREIILDLERAGHIKCARSGRGIASVQFVRNGLNQSEIKIAPPPVKKIEPEMIEPAEETITAEEQLEIDQIRTTLSKAVAGSTFSKTEILRRGERHENWLHISLIYMVHVLSSQYPEIVPYGSCSRSGRHDPAHGKVCLEDSWGADVTLYLVTKPLKDISPFKGRIIYDSKGSHEDVKKINKQIRMYPGQTSALRKKAIWANIFKRSQKNLISEVLQDIIEVGLLPADFNKDGALKFFED